MVRRILRQTHVKAVVLRKIDHPMQKLGAPTMVLRPSIKIDHQVVMWAKRQRTISHHSTSRSIRQSLVTLEVTP